MTVTKPEIPAALTAAEIAAVEAFRAAETARVAALTRYNAYLKLCDEIEILRYAKDDRFYAAWQKAEQASRYAAQALSVALGCQPAARPGLEAAP